MAGGVLAFDLSPSWCGWSYIQGATFLADSFHLGGVTTDLGGMGRALTAQVRILRERFDPAHVAYEAPILLSHDTLTTLRCTYGIGMVLETLCAAWGIPCTEVGLQSIKHLLTDDRWGEKKDVAKAIESLGVRLPSEGRLDAGDAAGCALVTLQRLNPEDADVWLAKIKGWLL